MGLTLALRNLVDNAVKFTRDRSRPKVEIGAWRNEGSWTIMVRDNGIGFDMEYHDQIFQIFQRLHRMEDFPGTGVGLAIVDRAMRRMGGRVWAESELGGGTTFFLGIPDPKVDPATELSS
jgi:signal transduction histidine kinase